MLISHAIPMSIYVAIEVLKWFQVKQIAADHELLRDPKQPQSQLMLEQSALMTNPAGAQQSSATSSIRTNLTQLPRTSVVRISNTEIIENLGQANLCVCDKTGTLTQNRLTLRKIYTDSKVLSLKLADEVWSQQQRSTSA